MLKDKRSLCLDICNYENKVICNLYDNTADVSGQAFDVFVKTERNGWKELSFKLPSTCTTADGDEENYRLQYLIADYRIRLQTEKETDWYIISEPKIIHDKFSKNVEVTAGHICQLLKTKNLSLEFSDEEGNNVGTAEQLLQTILDGTGWVVGDVAEFYEDDGETIKVRSIQASAKTGAFKLITTMCDKFDAKPIYHGHNRSVDIVPMNPFSDVEGPEIPKEVLEGENVIELHYDKNISNLSRTLNTDNLVTRLYAYGSFGEQATGYCSLGVCSHTEYKFTLPANYSSGQEFMFQDAAGAKYYFSVPTSVTKSTVLVWSELDPLSRSYVYNTSLKTAYNVYKEPTTNTYVTLTGTTESVKNKFDYLMDFSYYEKVDLLTANMKQELATFQREMPDVIEASEDAAAALIACEMELSEVAESNTGFLRLDVSSYATGPNGELKLILNKATYPDGVMYRSDYLEAKRNYFSWYCAEALKENGDPTSGIGSVVYIVHQTDPQTWEKAYVKYIDDEVKTNAYGMVDSVDPTTVTLWFTRNKMPTLQPLSTDRFYLFCTNSNSGRLGVRESELESLERTLQNTTKIITEEHPTYFVWDNEPAPSTDVVRNSYGWYYRSYHNNMNMGDLYFSYGEASWHPVILSDTTPAVQNGSYYFNLRSRKLYHGVNGEWVWYEDTEGKRLATNFSKVSFYCLKHDMIYKGLFDKYIYTVTANSGLVPGNYAIQNDYGFYWVFTTDKTIQKNKSLWVDTVKNLVFQTDNTEDVVKPEAKPFDTIDFPIANNLEDIGWTQGTLDKEKGTEVNSNTLYRSNNITLYGGSTYQYNVPANSFVVYYNSKRRYVGWANLSTSGTITLSQDTKYVRFVIGSALKSTNFLRVQDYTNKLFISDKEYKIISPITTAGSRIGLMYLIKAFADTADECYLNYLPAYNQAQAVLKQRNDALTAVLGDLYREGYWQKNEYVEGDEDKLYKDSFDNLVKIAKPEATYNITFLDLYGANQDVGYSVDGSTEEVEWPDIEMSDAAHLIDEDIDVNCWAFLDKIEKCYDKPWQTKIEINTNLSLLGQHTFTDVMAKIAEVANDTQAKQTIYKRAAALTGTGKMTAAKLEGAIQTNKVMITGGASNWYTDNKGNIVLESADGQSAMMLTGSGWAVANARDAYGDWDFRYTASGQGLTGDYIVGGTISGTLIEAGSITVDQINAAVGQELDIGSNTTLLLYATVDGLRPSGSLQTNVSNGDGTFRPVGEGDSYIRISAKEGNTPAQVDIMTGGILNLYGSTMNLAAKSDMNLLAGTTLNIRSDSDIEINAKSKLNIMAGSDLTIRSPHFNVYRDANNMYRADIDGTVKAKAGNIAGFTIGAAYKDGAVQDPEIDANVKWRYIYSGTDSLTSAAKGIYIGTNGINVSGGKIKYVVDTDTLTVAAEYVAIAKQSSGSGTLLTLDAQTGVINMAATNTINVVAGSTVNITSGKKITIASTGSVAIGSTGKPFTIGSNGTNAYIYNGVDSMDSAATSGIYLGTNGIRLGAKNVFSVTESGALTAMSADIKGKVQAQTGRIGSVDGVGGWIIEQNMIYADNKTVVLNSSGSYRIYAGSETASAAAFYVMKDGTISATKGNVAGWSIDTEKFLSSNKLVGISSTPGTDNTGIAFYAGNATPASAPFKVNHKGDLTATSADIKGVIQANTGYIGGTSGWVIASQQFYSANQTTGMSAIEGTNNVAIWAGKSSGKTTAESPFYVTHGGKLVSTSADITGKITSTDADVKGTIRAKALYIGSDAQTLVQISDNKLVLNSSDLAYIGAADSGVYITPTSIKVMTTGTFELKSTNFEVSTTGEIKAIKGTIGAWVIDDKELTSDNGDIDYHDGMGNVSTFVGLSTDPANAYAIWCGNKTAGDAPFRVRRNGLCYVTKVVDLDEEGHEQIIDLGKYSLGKLQYSTVVSVGDDGTVKLSNGKTFDTAASVSISGSWSGLTYTAKAKTKSGNVVDTKDIKATLQVVVDTTYGKMLKIGVFPDGVTPVGSSALATKSVTLVEKKDDKKVTAEVDGYAKAEISTEETYKAGRSAGWDKAREKCETPGAGSTTSFIVKWPGTAYDTQGSMTFTLSKSSGNEVLCKWGSTTVAKVTWNDSSSSDD